jgi:hypothetical protein
METIGGETRRDCQNLQWGVIGVNLISTSINLEINTMSDFIYGFLSAAIPMGVAYILISAIFRGLSLVSSRWDEVEG